MLKIILLLLPIILGAVVAIAKPKFVVSWTNKLNDWLMVKKKKFAEKDDTVSTFFIKPLIGGLCLIMEWTGNTIDDEFLLSGIRITLIIYFLAAMVLVAYVFILLITFALLVILLIAFLLLLFYIVIKIIIILWGLDYI